MRTAMLTLSAPTDHINSEVNLNKVQTKEQHLLLDAADKQQLAAGTNLNKDIESSSGGRQNL